MQFLYRPEMLPFEFLDPEKDKVLDFCLRNLLWSNPEKLRAFMGPDPTQSPFFSEFGESGFECRLRNTEAQELSRDWPKWAQYKVTAYDCYGQDRLVSYYPARLFEEHIRNGLRKYIKTFPDKGDAVLRLCADLELGTL